MPHRTIVSAAVALALLTAAAVPATAKQGSGPPARLLDVPFLPQSESLCGGAALAMVMRYWGAAGVYPETFSGLVDRAAGGIRGQDLLDALTQRGWEAVSVAGTGELLREQIAAGHPLVALVEDRPGRFHYVVVVGWTGSRMVLHDPARSPFRVVDERAFTSAWRASGFWTLLALPPDRRAPSLGSGGLAHPAAVDGARSTNVTAAAGDAADLAASRQAPCDAIVAEGVRLAQARDLDDARSSLGLATEVCSASASAWREMAGLDALEADWAAAAVSARRATELDPTDQHAWRILATSQYLQKDDYAALESWNHAGEPRVDYVSIAGLRRTRYGIVSRATGLTPEALLTPARLRAAERRLTELPTSQAARASYTPVEDARARIDAVVAERSSLPASRVEIAAAALHAGTDRAVQVHVVSPSGGGELWSGTWRWWRNRPMLGMRLAVPAPFGGTWAVEVWDDSQTYRVGTDGRLVDERRFAASLHVCNWTSSGLRWEIGGGLDRWESAVRTGRLTVGVEQRLLEDRASLSAKVAALKGGIDTWTLTMSGDWRSQTRNEGRVLIARVGLEAAGSAAPLALWPGAGTGQGRTGLLRAHPLLHGGIVSGEAFGRRLASANTELRVWSFTALKMIRIAPAAFVDVARIDRGLMHGTGRWHADAGGGLRIAIPGAGMLRLDLARGLLDGGAAFSVGWAR